MALLGKTDLPPTIARLLSSPRAGKSSSLKVEYTKVEKLERVPYTKT